MKKEIAWKIFKFFSILLIIDFALMPVASFIDPKSEGCGDYIFLECIAWFLILPLVAGFIWLVLWWKAYATSYLDEKKIEKWNKKFPILSSILIAFGRGPYFNKSNNSFTIQMFLIFCAGIAMLFLYQFYHILQIIIK